MQFIYSFASSSPPELESLECRVSWPKMLGMDVEFYSD